MADGALEATERQFVSLLESASDDFLIRLSFYSLPCVPRNEAGSRHIRGFYLSTEDLWDTHLDGLITTGREPLTKNLSDEPYWDSLTKVLGWARENTHSSVWSCLAAHAALLHMDGIGRVRSNQKHCGIFECTQVANHCLTAGTPSRMRLPHSRWNGILEDPLKDCGYRVLTRANGAGVDTFVKHDKSMFVFFQGHPEYESTTLLSEYRRDVGRFLKKETATYPSMPEDYFDELTMKALTHLREEAMSYRREELLKDVSIALGNTQIDNTWQDTAARIYRNWLEFIWAEKEQRLRARQSSTKVHEMQSLIPALATAGDISVSCPTSEV
jgi:homoserine O-succinyltransferase